MALSTVVSSAAARHRAASLANGDLYQGALALDWANGQSISPTASSVQSAVFDANNDRIVFVSTTANIWITVGTNPVASVGGAGNMVILATMPPTPVYVPANMLIAAIQSATVSLIPALYGT